ncbi:hypothetical protein K3740_15165 [Ruegeria conchae]|uniref:hypothetical protein n=1 Tax=Ruegeria conchae TaxID=981384 RepID=UPI0021A25C91|nr:hypothetical protein [Ruegeria conchae]UWR02373.1 hypothetical protein K3740_15165 [Ruegeria conchae]
MKPARSANKTVTCRLSLEAQAEKASFKDKGEFAAILLTNMLELMEARDREEDEELAALVEAMEKASVQEPALVSEIDDDILF